jgi:hypothetical protein
VTAVAIGTVIKTWIRKALLVTAVFAVFSTTVWITGTIHRLLEIDRCRGLGTWNEIGGFCERPWVEPKT